MTMRRIETDAERITTEPAFLAVDDVRRAINISRLKRLLAAQALNDPEVAYCQVWSIVLIQAHERMKWHERGGSDGT